MSLHNKKIIEQFSLQAIPFGQMPAHSDSIGKLIELSRVTPSSIVLDLACGPGIVACEFAKCAKHVTGVDLTPAMIEQALRRQKDSRLTNMDWMLGDVSALPFPDKSFSTVVTRYSFHHFEKPKDVLAEMVRVCATGGSVLVADVVLPSEKVEAYDALERLRDNSHVHALTHEEMSELFSSSGLKHVSTYSYKVEIGLEQQLRASFPGEGDAQKIRKMFINELSDDRMGVNAHLRGNEIFYEVPITVLVGEHS